MKTGSIGSFCLVRQKAPSGGFLPSWAVMLRVPGEKRVMKSGEKFLPGAASICPECLAFDGSPGEREDCRCQKPLRKFLGKYLEELARVRLAAIQRGDVGILAQLRSLSAPVAVLKLADICAVYELRGPKDAKKRVQQFRSMVEEVGFNWAGATMSLLTDEPLKWVRKWAELRQEHFRRGWSVRGAEPAGAWETLREDYLKDGKDDLKAGRVRPLDRSGVAPVNTTIECYLRAAKSIFGPEARSNYHGDLKVPPCPDFLGLRLSLPKPKGMKRIDDEVYREMWEAAERLRGEDLQLWALVQLAWRTGMRTVELLGARKSWLERANGKVFLVLKNRPEDGFLLKAKDRALVRPIELGGDLVAVLEGLDGEGLIGARSKTDAEELGRRASAWIRQFVTEGPHTLYWFRKLAGSVRYTSGDMRAAGALLGHAPGSTVTGDTYAELLAPVSALSDAEIAPGNVQLRKGGN